MGAPGTDRQLNADAMATLFGWVCINTGEILRKEVAKTTAEGRTIADCFAANEYGKSLIVRFIIFNSPR